MLKKCYRLKKNFAFTATYRLKNAVSDQYMIVYLGKKKTDNNILTRAGFVVSKKIHKRAVKRNRIKRLMRESYRILQKEGKLVSLNEHMSVIFIAKSNALGQDIKTINQSVRSLVQKIVSNA